MTFLLPLVALALALAAPFLARGEHRAPSAPRFGVLALLGALAAGVAFRYAPEGDRVPALMGLVLGAVVCALGAWSEGPAAGAAGASALHLLPASPATGLAFLVGTGLGALTVGGEAAALAGALVFAADDLGSKHSQVPAMGFVGSQVGVALAVGALLIRLVPERAAFARPFVPFALVAGAGFFVAQSLGEKGFGPAVAAGGLAAVVLHFLMPGDEGDSSRVGLGTVIGVALATVAFGLARGAGVGLAALAAVGGSLAVGNARAALALGPLVGLVLFRVLREAGTGATRALDIGQHYTLLALVLGLALPLLPADWLKARTNALGAFLWGLVLLGAAPLLVVALGMRGGVGFVVGLGCAGLVQALRVVRENGNPREGDTEGLRFAGTEACATSLLPLALGTGLGGATILALRWLGDDSALSRDAKLWLFAYAAVAIAVIAGMLALAGRRKEEAK